MAEASPGEPIYVTMDAKNERVREHVRGSFGEEEVVRRALGMARPGDLVMIFADKLSRAWDQIVSFKPSLAAAAEPLMSGGALVGALEAGSGPN